ncbi:MAG TPA: GrpB family protein, partial [Dehalococcoidia bacterium]|nr:GrpB family protein [Dehalococcoidia bacterium]
MSDYPTSSIIIADYDARWPALFEQEKARILDAAGRWLADVQHVGSTAVPGLAAKPIIDICAGLRSHQDGERCVGPLQALGYEYLGEAGIPRRYYFRKPTDSPVPGQTFGANRP